MMIKYVYFWQGFTENTRLPLCVYASFLKVLTPEAIISVP
jgi:hypothetical protein